MINLIFIGVLTLTIVHFIITLKFFSKIAFVNFHEKKIPPVLFWLGIFNEWIKQKGIIEFVLVFENKSILQPWDEDSVNH